MLLQYDLHVGRVVPVSHSRLEAARRSLDLDYLLEDDLAAARQGLDLGLAGVLLVKPEGDHVAVDEVEDDRVDDVIALVGTERPELAVKLSLSVFLRAGGLGAVDLELDRLSAGLVHPVGLVTQEGGRVHSGEVHLRRVDVLESRTFYREVVLEALLDQLHLHKPVLLVPEDCDVLHEHAEGRVGLDHPHLDDVGRRSLVHGLAGLGVLLGRELLYRSLARVRLSGPGLVHADEEVGVIFVEVCRIDKEVVEAFLDVHAALQALEVSAVRHLAGRLLVEDVAGSLWLAGVGVAVLVGQQLGEAEGVEARADDQVVVVMGVKQLLALAAGKGKRDESEREQQCLYPAHLPPPFLFT